MSSKICIFNQFGHCKFEDRCPNKHIDEICRAKNCVSNSCVFRHPKNCRNLKKLGFCVFDIFCSYNHEFSVATEVELNSEHGIPEEKHKREEASLVSAVNELKVEIKNLKQNIRNLQSKFKNEASPCGADEAVDQLEEPLKEIDEKFEPESKVVDKSPPESNIYFGSDLSS